MSEFIIPEKNKRNFQDIIFTHIERILDMTKNEFTGGYYNTTYSGTLSTKNYVSDKKEEYCQLVEALADILCTRFDKEMKEAYNDYEQRLNEAIKKYHDENEIPKDMDSYRIFSKIRLKLTRQLFRDLNLLLGRIEYLKGQTYTQQDLQDAEPDVIDVDEARA